MQDAAGMVQAAFDQKDMDALASLCAYPLTYSDQSGSSARFAAERSCVPSERRLYSLTACGTQCSPQTPPRRRP